jgi:hypothetical protein
VALALVAAVVAAGAETLTPLTACVVPLIDEGMISLTAAVSIIAADISVAVALEQSLLHGDVAS